MVAAKQYTHRLLNQFLTVGLIPLQHAPHSGQRGRLPEQGASPGLKCRAVKPMSHGHSRTLQELHALPMSKEASARSIHLPRLTNLRSKTPSNLPHKEHVAQLTCA